MSERAQATYRTCADDGDVVTPGSGATHRNMLACERRRATEPTLVPRDRSPGYRSSEQGSGPSPEPQLHVGLTQRSVQFLRGEPERRSARRRRIAAPGISDRRRDGGTPPPNWTACPPRHRCPARPGREAQTFVQIGRQFADHQAGGGIQAHDAAPRHRLTGQQRMRCRDPRGHVGPGKIGKLNRGQAKIFRRDRVALDPALPQVR